MPLLQRLRQLLRRPLSASTVGVRRQSPSAPKRGDTVHEDALRAVLVDDPNNEEAFQALAEVVRRRAAEWPGPDDPLAASPDDQTAEEVRAQAADLAVWSLAEELAGHPRGWYPLLELGRLSLADDPEGAVRRLTTAAERDPGGRALAEGLAILRDAGMHVEALGLGVGHWRVRDHTPEVGRHLVLAAIDADRVLEARHHLDALATHPDKQAVARLRPDLERAITEAEAARGGAPA
ncbi:hypothetical protein [Antribacter gilvus]|uniref:hypothetical protein n=1 Tax=Antribacter gilvus TaxID=2304675 RepID=UPI000F7A5626|nr:hypothetical protein [Antribacter gilvus]